MLKKSKEYLKIKEKVKESIDDDVLDVILFGSFVKGKYKPNDIDLCIVFRKEINHSLAAVIRKKLKTLSLHVSMLTADNFFQKFHNLAPTILFEGISVLDDKFIAEKYGARQMYLYRYDVSSMSQSAKTRFVRLLRGKGNLVQGLGGRFIAPGVFLLPIEKDGEILEFLEHWRVTYSRTKVLLLS